MHNELKIPEIVVNLDYKGNEFPVCKKVLNLKQKINISINVFE